MSRRFIVFVAVILGLALLPAPAFGQAERHVDFSPGAPGVGDAYYPLDGNGGYDVQHYDLRLKYQPATAELDGVARILAKSTQNLSSFNLDLEGLDVTSIKVNGSPATWIRDSHELTITPRSGLRAGGFFLTEVRYSGFPVPLGDTGTFGGGWIPTDDGALVVGQPHGATSWFPVNDHPSDKASYTIRITVPDGVEAVSNGRLLGSTSKNGWTTWNWFQLAPMASYLATATIGDFKLTSYTENGIHFVDAIDPDLFKPAAVPHSGDAFLYSQQADVSYKRLARTITVPAGGAQMSFWTTRFIEQDWDFMFVEARPAGTDEWTTLPDLNGHTSDGTGNNVCGLWLTLHPFLSHYQSGSDDAPCAPTGTTGSWSAATGVGDGDEQWLVDLAAYAGQDVELSISYASDDIFQAPGVFVDDIEVSTGEGTTSFEDDGDTLDGWSVTGAPDGSVPNENDWAVIAVDEVRTIGTAIEESFAREPEILEFLGSNFGRYPFGNAGGIVDDVEGLGFALENQSRPIYALDFWANAQPNDGVVVHELAHQWFGDSVAVAQWRDIWLNEGFATYAEWLWYEHDELVTAQQIFDNWYAIPADSPYWALVIGDPGPEPALFDQPVYSRGAMTLHQLRLAVGDEAFFDILKTWASSKAGKNGSTPEFIALAEQISGQDLDGLFQAWLYSPTKPATVVEPTLAEASAQSVQTTNVQRYLERMQTPHRR